MNGAIIAEEWRPIGEFIGFEVSSLGRVRSLDRAGTDGRRLKGKIRALVPGTNGYLLINFYVNGRSIGRSVHSLVALAFLGPVPEGMEINHKDGVKHNNVYTNLEHITPSGNHYHALEFGLRKPLKGVDAPRAKLTEAQVREIRLKARTMTNRALAAEYGIGKSTVQQIVSGAIWKHLV